jgi:AAHS family 4-hydroxybenzoate transporter-like MFS transporter
MNSVSNLESTPARPHGWNVDQEVDVGELIDSRPMGRYQRFLVALTAVTIVFDGADIQLLGIALPSIIRDWATPRAAFATVLAVGLIGMMAGSAIAGVLGDRYGRKRVLLGSVALFGLATMAMSLADGLLTLGILRFVVGCGVGGALPNATALAAEYVPVRRRAIAVTLTIVSVPIGGTLAGLFALAVLPSFGWRTLFAVGGFIPLAAVAVLGLLLVESPRYLASQPSRRRELLHMLTRFGHSLPESVRIRATSDGSQVKPSIATVLKPEFRRDTLALWTAYVTCMLAVYLGFNWIPVMLTGAGLSPSVGSAGITAFNLGGVFGALAGALIFGRLGSLPTMLAMALAACVGAVVLATFRITSESAAAPIVLMLGITGGLITGLQVVMFALAAQMYPAPVRSTGVGAASSIGRAGGIASTFIGAWALERGGSPLFFVAIAVSILLSGVSLAVIRRHISPHVASRA